MSHQDCAMTNAIAENDKEYTIFFRDTRTGCLERPDKRIWTALGKGIVLPHNSFYIQPSHAFYHGRIVLVSCMVGFNLLIFRPYLYGLCTESRMWAC